MYNVKKWRMHKKTCVSLKNIWFAYLKLRDHSKIVDLVFLILTKKFSAPETSKTPHSWQNNVPTSWLVVCKPPTSWLVICKPPTSWLVICKPPNHQPAGWLFANHQPAGWLFANHQPAGWLFANHQPWSPNPTLVAFRGPGHPKAIFKQKQQN